MLTATPGEPLSAPAPFTALKLSGELIAAGSEDGTVRLYRPSESKVFKAIRGLGNEVSSVAFAPGTSATPDTILVAAGQHIFSFDLGTSKLVLQRGDAVVSKRLLDEEDGENVLNEIALTKTHLAFTCDDGRVGVYDLATQDTKFLKPRHKSVAAPIAFVPNRPRELVSGGYDCTLLHTDYLLGSYLSSLDFSGGAAPSTTVPPFIHAMDVSPEGRIACGLADGRIWIGSGGIKRTGSGKAKKWDGLDEEHGCFLNVATGPVVGVAFRDETSVFISSLNGVLKLVPTEQVLSEGASVDTLWLAQWSTGAKVNALAYDSGRLAVAGVTREGKGALETWVFSEQVDKQQIV